MGIEHNPGPFSRKGIGIERNPDPLQGGDWELNRILARSTVGNGY